MPIKIFATGGTFDKEYNELNGSLFFRHTHLPEILKLGRSHLSLTVDTLMMMDSLEMTPEDREKIAQACVDAPEKHIIITHGTDTMTETAAVLAEKVTGKTVIITGALVPYKLGSSDALFNLGSALAFVQVLPPGIYISMNGRYFNWDKVQKNKETGIFEEI